MSQHYILLRGASRESRVFPGGCLSFVPVSAPKSSFPLFVLISSSPLQRPSSLPFTTMHWISRSLQAATSLVDSPPSILRQIAFKRSRRPRVINKVRAICSTFRCLVIHARLAWILPFELLISYVRHLFIKREVQQDSPPSRRGRYHLFLAS